jgi:hypothetical protein
VRALAKVVAWGVVGWLVAPIVAGLWIIAAAAGIELVDRLAKWVRNDVA